MNNLIETYKNEILEKFKINYKKTILKNSNITYQMIQNLTLEECQLQTSTNNSINYLEDWFLKIHQLNFLKPIFSQTFFELIFHSAEHAILISNQKRENLNFMDLSEEDYQLALESLALQFGQKWNYQNPFVSFTANLFNKNYRITLIHFSCSATLVSKMFIRAQVDSIPCLEMFDLEIENQELINKLIMDKKNILISGGTSSGKTTFLRSVIPLINHQEHLIVLEDTYEIINSHPGQTSMLANKEFHQKSLKEYCAYALRMSPDRLIIGEMRSSEVVPFVLAMNTGHKGLMSTIHANSAIDALHRAALLFLLFSESAEIPYSLVLKLLTKSIDVVIHIEDKKVKEIISITGSDGDIPFYETLTAS